MKEIFADFISEHINLGVKLSRLYKKLQLASFGATDYGDNTLHAQLERYIVFFRILLGSWCRTTNYLTAVYNKAPTTLIQFKLT